MKTQQELIPGIGERPYSAVGFSIIISILIYLALPLTQIIDNLANREEQDIIRTTEPPPPPPPVDIVTKEVEQTKEEQVELKEEQQQVSIDQLEFMMNVDISDAFVSDTSIPLVNIGAQIEDIVYSISEMDERPQPLNQVAPNIPHGLKGKLSGSIMLEFIIDKEGYVLNPWIVSSSNELVNKAHLDAVRKWRFRPGIRKGKPEKVKVRQRFDLN
jgi:protein TonB